MSKDLDDLKKKRIEMGLDDAQNIVDPDEEDDIDDNDEEDEDLDDLVEDDDESDDEGEDDDSDEDESGEHNRSGKSVPASRFQSVRAKEAAERKRADKAEADLAELRKTLSEQEGEKPTVSDDQITQAAAGMVSFPANASEDQKKQILEATKKNLRQIIDLTLSGVKVPKDYEDLKKQVDEFKDRQTFNDEWDNFSDEIPKLYPAATTKQVRLARKAMDDLSHAEQFSDKEFDYVFYKNRKIFDRIFRKLRKTTFEGESQHTRPDQNDDSSDGSKLPAKKISHSDLVKRKKQMDQEASAQDNASGWNINNPNGQRVR